MLQFVLLRFRLHRPGLALRSSSTSFVPRAALAVLAMLCWLCLSACHALAPKPKIAPLDPAASAAFEEARAWLRASQILEHESGVATADEESATPARTKARQNALAALERAIAIDPKWVAPWRVKDELLREDLRGLEALENHLAALAQEPDNAAREYLVGRLLGTAAMQRFERAARLDASLSWAWHGLAFVSSSRGRFAEAATLEQRALNLARDSYERSFFTAAKARYLVASDQSAKALELLRARLKDSDLLATDTTELAVQTARVELSMLFRPEARAGQQRALELLRERDLTDQEVEALATELRLVRSSDGHSSLELELALAARAGRARDRMRAELLLDQRPTPLALGLLRRSRESSGLDLRQGGPLLRAARFAAGDFSGAVEDWLADLPRVVLDQSGMPADAGLRSVVQFARGLPARPDAAVLARFGEELLAVGWFREARSVASAIATHDLDAALSLDERAAAGQDLVSSMRRVLYSVDERASARLADPEGPRAPRNLSSLLSALAPVVARARRELGGEFETARVSEELLASPRIDYGPVAQIIHPGPRFSSEDEAQGKGPAGQSVPGLASVLDKLGRFAIVGQVMGSDPPDAVLLQRVHVIEESGSHLGTAWKGTTAWCDGTEVRSRAGRLGASIAGAALHEGYWIDIDAVRRERDDWQRFEREFFSVDDGRVERALALRGLPLATLATYSKPDRRESGVFLGQSDRVRLAILAQRRREQGSLAHGLVGLDELIANTAIHEQAHLCDRARFLPISRNLGRVLAFVATVGLNPSKIAERLEYRAELVALCRAKDPRVVLVGLLRASEQREGGLTPHASAYAQALRDFLSVLDQELTRDPTKWPELSPDHFLVHQLHRLGAEKVRQLGLLVARREGLSD